MSRINNKYLCVLDSHRISVGWLSCLNTSSLMSSIELGHFKANNIRSEAGLIFMSWFGNRPACYVKKHKKRGGYTLYLATKLFDSRAGNLSQKLYYLSFLLFKEAGLRNLKFQGLGSKYFERLNFSFTNDLELSSFLTWRLLEVERKHFLTPLLVTGAFCKPTSDKVLSEFYFRAAQIPMAYYYRFKDNNVGFY